MSKWLLAVAVFILGAALAVPEAEARRLGGARSLGVQRSVTPPPARPAQQQAAPAQQSGAQSAAPSAGSRWMPILGGLAIGGLLGSLFGGSGLGAILLLGLLAFAAVALFRALAARGAGSTPLRYAAAGDGVPPSAPPLGGAGGAPALAPGFDAEAFLRAARNNFLRLQAANDRGDLEAIREFTTAEMFEALKDEPRLAGQRTDVADLAADVLEVATEGDRHWASVRFAGTVREAPSAPAERFEEVWTLVKPTDGSSGWLLAGIQQLQ